MSSWHSMERTFLASIRSIGTAVAMASVGAYMHRRGFISAESKRFLALLSQQVTFPLFLFTKIIYCNQDWSTEECPDVRNSIREVWLLLLWPLAVVGLGCLVGLAIVHGSATRPPWHQRRAVLASVMFPNNTALPITLLTVVHTNFPSDSNLGRIDPTIFLSVYLLLYPILQWGLGGWLLAPSSLDHENDGISSEESETESSGGGRPSPDFFLGGLLEEAEGGDNESEEEIYQELPPEAVVVSPKLTKHHHHHHRQGRSLSLRLSLRKNLVNNRHHLDNEYVRRHRGLASADEGLYLSLLDLAALDPTNQAPPNRGDEQHPLLSGHTAKVAMTPDHASVSNYTWHPTYQFTPTGATTSKSPITTPSANLMTSPFGDIAVAPATSLRMMMNQQQAIKLSEVSLDDYDASIWETCWNVLRQCLQPPVLGAIAGICVAITPARGILVDLSRHSDAPLQWLFDGLYKVGSTAVPINMLILGCNLSASHANARTKSLEPDTRNDDKNYKSTAGLLPHNTMVAIVIGKMVVLPLLGMALALFVQNSVLTSMSEDVATAFYLVALIVFLTPTANNVMAMVELSGSNVKEGIAQVIGMQYIVAPFILPITMTIAIGIASNWQA